MAVFVVMVIFTFETVILPNSLGHWKGKEIDTVVESSLTTLHG